MYRIALEYLREGIYLSAQASSRLEYSVLANAPLSICRWVGWLQSRSLDRQWVLPLEGLHVTRFDFVRAGGRAAKKTTRGREASRWSTMNRSADWVLVFAYIGNSPFKASSMLCFHRGLFFSRYSTFHKVYIYNERPPLHEKNLTAKVNTKQGETLTIPFLCSAWSSRLACLASSNASPEK